MSDNKNPAWEYVVHSGGANSKVVFGGTKEECDKWAAENGYVPTAVGRNGYYVNPDIRDGHWYTR